MFDIANSQIVAEYEYGPFGELIQATGKMAKEFNILFSTKYYDWETGLYYYGYRYYSPTIGRWLSRDPIGEKGGVNLYTAYKNDPVNSVDPLGLSPELRPGSQLSEQEVNKVITISAGLHFNDIEKARAVKALCLIRKLIGPIYYPEYSDLYWAQRFTPDLEGLNVHVVPGNDYGGYWVFINKRFWPQEEYQLNPMIAFGIVLAHEFDHYNTNSKDPIPANRVDVPAFAAANAKLGKKICMECKNHNPVWRITNELEKLACECDINVGLNPKR